MANQHDPTYTQDALPRLPDYWFTKGVTMDNDGSMSYIGRKPCGCVVCAIVDRGDDDQRHRRTVANEVAQWIKWGLTIERVTHQYVRENFTADCSHEAQAAGQQSLFSEQVLP